MARSMARFEVLGSRFDVEDNYGDSDSSSQNDDGSGFAEASGEDGGLLAVVAEDAQETLFIEAGGGASIAGGAVAGFDADAFSIEPSGVAGGVRGSRFEVRGKTAEFGVEGEEDGGGERFAAEDGRVAEGG